MEWSEFEIKINRWRVVIKNDPWLKNYFGDPLVYKLIWKLKIQIRPVYFVNPILLALNFSIFFIFVMGFLTKSSASSFGFIYIGIALGVIVAVYIRVLTRMKKLPNWEDL